MLKADSGKLKADFRNIWVVAELENGEVNPVSHETGGRGRGLADTRSSELWIIAAGNLKNIDDLADEFFYADRILIINDERLTGFNDETESELIRRLIEKYRPETVIYSATARGRSIAPRIAVLSDAGLTADCTSLDIEDTTGNLLQTRPAFGGNILATIKSENHRPQMATVRPGVMKNHIRDRKDYQGRKPLFINESLNSLESSLLKNILSVNRSSGIVHSIADSELIISGGRGLGCGEAFRSLDKFAKMTGGAIAASRGAVDAGWVPYSLQIGQTGQTVQARCYIACGISGQIQHLVGMQSCELIIAINRDPEAPMMKIADVAVTGDAVDIVERMSEIMERGMHDF